MIASLRKRNREEQKEKKMLNNKYLHLSQHAKHHFTLWILCVLAVNERSVW